MKDVRIVFLGTPKIAAVVLQGLIDSKYNIVGVVSQPDKIVGRKKILTMTPVKEVAIANNLPIFQPISLKKDYQFLIDLKPDLLITTAYGQILPNDVLKIATINNINVHGSLLPKYRGGAPIQRSIMNGDKETGVTIMKMVDKMDAGEMYAKETIPLNNIINSSELFEKMAIVGKDLLLKTLPNIINGTIHGISQDENEVTFAFNIKPEEEKISFNNTVNNIHNIIRGLSNTPGAYCLYNNKKIKIYSSIPSNLKNDNCEIGTLKILNKNELYVKCVDGYLQLLTIQVEGKTKMSVKDYLNGINKEQFIKERLQ